MCLLLRTKVILLNEFALFFKKKHDPLINMIFSVTLHDIVHTEKSLTLVFEYLEKDLKQYMDDCGAILAISNVKLFLFQV